MDVGAHTIHLVSSNDLAAALGFAAPNEAFRGFCRNIGITPVRRNPNYYDPKLVRVRLDQAQGLQDSDQLAEKGSLVDQRRARRGTA
jgi:hypothetical protein